MHLGRFKTFADAWKLIRTGLEKWRRDGGDGLWSRAGTVLRRVAMWGGIPVAVAGTILLALAATGAVAAAPGEAQRRVAPTSPPAWR
ncbi:hypothetical protein AB0I28_30235 [Phytomonospora sp. NPDC050363]|uniref:hypothetical protein n=1 Tax=Phytomonospora sp. NPDC050363 TaxID=3155642 RepID=UPI0033F12F1D